jgi:mono/diheme cytochrome c family protein
MPGVLFAVDPAPVAPAQPASASSPTEYVPSAERGYSHLRTRAYLPNDFDQGVFESLWKTWPSELRRKAQATDEAGRRRMAVERYGLVDHPDADPAGPGLGYVKTASGWAMNCFACHSGTVAGQAIPGAPNTLTALMTLTEEVRMTKLMQAKPLSHLDVGSLTIPLGTTVGSTNAVMFGVALMARRDKEMNVVLHVPDPKLVHHDMDPPAWWTTRKKKRIYADGFAARSHRLLLQFVLLPMNGPDRLKAWENDYRDVLAYIESLEAPKYPYPIDEVKAEQGRVLFENNCSRCHGTYGPGGEYPNRIVPIEELGTDPVRLTALTPEHRKAMSEGWMGEYGSLDYLTDPPGYLAPPLDGVWASAPYFHNGSVPTLWHVLNPDERPVVWSRSIDGFDTDRVGLDATEARELPRDVKSAADKRWWFDTRGKGKSSAGHRYPLELSPEERRSVLEYLKTL